MANKELATVNTDIEVTAVPASPLVFNTNFSEVRKELKKLEKYKDIVVTDDNFESCKLIQKNCVSLRTLLENRKKETVKTYIELPKDTIVAQFNDLMRVVASVEDTLKRQFDVYDEQRKEELTKIIGVYIDMEQKEFSLPPNYLSRVEIKKGYFNKTQKESDTRSDIKEQFKALKAELDTYNLDCTAIRDLCKGNDALNPEIWIKNLEYRSLSSVIADINSELSRLRSSPKKSEPTVVKKPKKGFKVMTIEITYPEDKGDVIRNFFALNKDFKVREV